MDKQDVRQPVQMFYGPPDYQPENLHLRDITTILRRNWIIIVSCGVLLAIAGVLTTSRKAPTYAAKASIRIEERGAGALSILDPVFAGGSQIETEIEILRSRNLVGAVVDSLVLQLQFVTPRYLVGKSLFDVLEISPDAPRGEYELRSQPAGGLVLVDRATDDVLAMVSPGQIVMLPGVQFRLSELAEEHTPIQFNIVSRNRAIDRILGPLQVARRGTRTNIVDIQFFGADPQIVREVPDVLVAKFLAQRAFVHQAEARSTAVFLRQQLDRLTGQLVTAEDSLRSFREAEQVVNIHQQSTSAVSQVAGLQAERNTLQAERAALASFLAELQPSLQSSTGGTSQFRRLLSFPSLLRNQVVVGLLNSLTTTEDRVTELLARRSLADPEVQLLTNRIAELEAQLRGMVYTYLVGLEKQIAANDAILARSQGELRRIPAQEVRLARLQRDTESLEGIIGTLQSRLKEVEVAEAVEDLSVRPVDAAVLPRAPMSQKPVRNGLLGLIVGLGIGSGLAFVRGFTDKSVRTRRDVIAATGVPVLGLVPRVGHPRRSIGHRVRHFSPGQSNFNLRGALRLTSTADKNRPNLLHRDAQVPAQTSLNQPLSDAFARLHTNISFARSDAPLKTLLITSALPGEGKTTSAINLGITLAQRGKRTLLLDGDFRRASIGAALKLSREPGLVNVLQGTATLQESLHVVPIDGGVDLHIMTAGTLPQNPAQLLAKPGMRGLFELWETMYDYIVIDSPPINLVPDAALLSAYADGVILVARCAVTETHALAFTMEQLGHARAPVLGVILNDIDFERDRGYDSAYQYYYSAEVT